MAYNILVVDDSLPTRAVIKKSLKASGFNVGQFFDASNGREALDILRDEWLDLVLTDYNMPDMNGMELIREMKKDDVLKDIPVVVITTEGSQQRVEAFLEMGATDYIKKPFTPEVIKNKLNTLLGEKDDGDQQADISNEDLDF